MWSGSSVTTMRSLLLAFGVLLFCASPSVAQLRHSHVCIADGCLRGFSMADVNNRRFDAFVGVPYAKSPVAKLRFQPPVPVDPWEEEYNATSSRSPCIQRSILLSNNPIVGDEDCLYLNVYRPVDNPNATQPHPVMVFIHGGGYFLGSADPRLYGPERILAASQRVILVTIQYRLGVFGFLSTGDRAAPGNAGMHDQVLALRWVQRNIGAFGGDPTAVTLFGESAGGASVQLHMMSPLSRGLFHRAILMSGSALAVWTLPVDDPLALARRQAKLVGVSEADELTSAELVDVLQYIDAKVLAGTSSQLRSWFEHPIVLYRPGIERQPSGFLTDDPRRLWAEGRYADIPILLGTVPNEGAVASLPILHDRTILDEFNGNLAKLMPAVLALNATESDLGRLKERYFPKAPAERWVNEENSQEFTRMFSDALIKYPTVKTLLEYINSPNSSSCRQTTLYSFEFTGRHSFASIYDPSANASSNGVCHQDELLYLFRMIDLFPEFPEDSPEAEMATTWTEFLVNFAVEGPSGGSTPPTCGEKVQTVTFKKAATPSTATGSHVLTTRGSGLSPELQEMHNFWNAIYQSSYIAYH